jgi:PAS domain-containing protein
MTRYDEVIPDFVPLSISSIERIKDCICWLSPEGKLLYANPQGMEALGYGAEEWRRLTIYDIDPRYTPEMWGLHFARLRETGSCTFETGPVFLQARGVGKARQRSCTEAVLSGRRRSISVFQQAAAGNAYR